MNSISEVRRDDVQDPPEPPPFVDADPVRRKGRVGTIVFGSFGAFFFLYNALFSGTRAAALASAPHERLPYAVGAMSFPVAIAVLVIGVGMCRRRHRTVRWGARGLFWSMLFLLILNIMTVAREAALRMSGGPM